jgi:hypothetical protein
MFFSFFLFEGKALYLPLVGNLKLVHPTSCQLLDTLTKENMDEFLDIQQVLLHIGLFINRKIFNCNIAIQC